MIYDKRGIPILPGDLIRTLHFVHTKRRIRRWLYHTVVSHGGHLWGVPTAELEPTKRTGVGIYILRADEAKHAEVIAGYGPDGVGHWERKRQKQEPKK